jgi:hypothetical protein
MLFFGGGALWAALVFPELLRRRNVPLPPRPEPWERTDVLVHTITITVLCTASTLGVLIWWPGSNGAWLVVTVLAVTQLGGRTGSRKRQQMAFFVALSSYGPFSSAPQPVPKSCPQGSRPSVFLA